MLQSDSREKRYIKYFEKQYYASLEKYKIIKEIKDTPGIVALSKK